MKSLLLLLFLIPLVPSIFAQTEIIDDIEEAGITPDSPFYFLDVALDQLFLNMETNNAKKAVLGLEIASERLSEVKLMIEANKIEHAEEAKKHHDKVIMETEMAVAEIENEDIDDISGSSEKLEEEIEIESRLEEHSERVDDITVKIQIKIRSGDSIPPDQLIRITSILNTLDDNVEKVKIIIDDEKIDTKIKIRKDTGKSEFQVEDLEDEYELKVRDIIESEKDDD